MSPAVFTAVFSGEGRPGTALSRAKSIAISLSPVVLERVQSTRWQNYGANSLRMRITKLLDGFILAVASQTANTTKYNSALNILLILMC